MRSIVNRSGRGSARGISSQRVILVKGDAHEIAPKAKARSRSAVATAESLQNAGSRSKAETRGKS